MRKVLLVPLDSRPCNTTWVQKFAKRGNLDLVMYPKELCGDLFEKANTEHVFSWIDENIAKTDYLILSLDMLCSGGLVPSRLGEFDIAKAKELINKFRIYKEKNPNLKIYGFDTLMRTTITSYNYQSAKLWAQINKYSKLKGELHIKYNQETEEELNALINEIDSNDLNKFLKTREKKHEMNLYYIDLVINNIFDYLLILQEDSQGNGIQLLEQKIILDKIQNNNLSNKVKLYNGTDEGASVLLAKVLVQTYNIIPNVYIHLPYKDTLDKIYCFEDRHFRENLNNMFDVIGINQTNIDNSDYILSIFAEKEIMNLDLDKYTSFELNKTNEYNKYIKELNYFINEKNNVALLDLTFPNGGSFELLSDINYKKLKGYSAWNTPSNSLGTLLCDMVCYLINENDNTFTKERILDDCIYQYIVRRRVNEILIDRNINIFNLGEHGKMAIDLIKKEFDKYTNMVDIKSCNIYLPWNRTFEIEIDVKE